MAFGTLALGCVSGLLAMIVGVLDFLDVPKDSPARDAAVTHLMIMCSAWLIFLVALALHGYPPTTPVPIAALIASATGFLAMAYGAWLGGKLVYEFGVGYYTRYKGFTVLSPSATRPVSSSHIGCAMTCAAMACMSRCARSSGELVYSALAPASAYIAVTAARPCAIA